MDASSAPTFVKREVGQSGGAEQSRRPRPRAWPRIVKFKVALTKAQLQPRGRVAATPGRNCLAQADGISIRIPIIGIVTIEVVGKPPQTIFRERVDVTIGLGRTNIDKTARL